jgi:hypothetical protein
LALLSSIIIYLIVDRKKVLHARHMIYPVAIYGVFLVLIFTML